MVEPESYVKQHQTRRRILIALIVIGIWVFLGLIYAAPVYVEMRAEVMNHAAWRIFSWATLTWSAWAIATPSMVWLARRFPLVGSRWKYNLLVHFPAFLIVSIFHSAVATFVVLSVKPFDNMGALPMKFWPRFIARLPSSVGSDLLIYGAVVGVCHAIDFYGKYRERESTAAQLETQLAKAQLDSLRMQLHPHFLFNTLNGIVGLVRDNRNDAAVGMLVGLSDLLRHALEHSDEQEIELREELNFIQLYLKIQQMRFSDRLKVHINAEDDVLKALVPNLLLQPLTENALKHGIGRSTKTDEVAINCQAEEGFLKISITDNGVGLPPNWQLRSSSGIGLANTLARLEQLYNGDHRLDVRNRPSGGVEVLIVVPLRYSKT
ncbi:MAG: sensor histidine kinase [Blastocatellia bacterium]|nr:MAG: sensor histidine kinase [Blastocatellia bacterium]